MLRLGTPIAGFILIIAGALPGFADEHRDLFNGKDLDGWTVEGVQTYKDGDAAKPIWTVQDGLIVCTGKGFGFLRYDRQQFGNFALRVEYRLARRSNSGIGIRTIPYKHKQVETRPSMAAYEIQLLDDAGTPPGKGSSGSLYRYVAPAANAVKPAPEWNTVEVEAAGPYLRVTINGQKVIDVDQSTVAEIKDKPLKGYICLQSHSGKVEFRKVQVREIRAGAGKNP